MPPKTKPQKNEKQTPSPPQKKSWKNSKPQSQPNQSRPLKQIKEEKKDENELIARFETFTILINANNNNINLPIKKLKELFKSQETLNSILTPIKFKANYLKNHEIPTVRLNHLKIHDDIGYEKFKLHYNITIVIDWVGPTVGSFHFNSKVLNPLLNSISTINGEQLSDYNFFISYTWIPRQKRDDFTKVSTYANKADMDQRRKLKDEYEEKKEIKKRVFQPTQEEPELDFIPLTKKIKLNVYEL